MNKIPEIFIISFLRDGVVENVSKLNSIEDNNFYIAKETNISILKIFDNILYYSYQLFLSIYKQVLHLHLKDF